jgi:hypothetical protein
MAETYTRVADRGGIPAQRGVHLHVYEVNVTSYPTSGFNFRASDMGLSKIRSPLALIPAETKGKDTTWWWDTVNNKILMYVGNTGAEVANTVDLGKFRLTLMGR